MNMHSVHTILYDSCQWRDGINGPIHGLKPAGLAQTCPTMLTRYDIYLKLNN